MNHENELVLALLLAGHLLADFVFQSQAMVERKARELRWLLAHGLEVLLVQSLVLVPFCTEPRVMAALAAAAVAHTCIDALKGRVERAHGRRLLWFVVDQLLHLAVLLLLAHWVSLERVVLDLQSFNASGLESLAWIVGLYAFNVNGGSAVVSAVLEGVRAGAPQLPGARAGRVIGILERMAMLTLVWMGEWSALGFVLAAKSVARFKELENREFAEAYLVGTLTSFLVAGASGLLLRAMLAS